MRSDELLQLLVPTGPTGSRALRRTVAPYGLLEMQGPDAADYLQRLCSQDVAAMGEADVQPAAFLDAKGKLQATCLVLRIGASFWLETQTEQVDRLAALLERYHFTEKLTIVRRESRCAEVIGRDHEPQLRRVMEAKVEAFTFAFGRRGISFRRTHAVAPIASAAAGAGESDALTPDTAECLRMLAGLVRVGLETEPTTLALEADLDDHISTTKGCYTGQEIVARIHTYGHTNRKLCLLLLAPGAPITAPLPLHEVEDQLAVGRVMHAVPIPERAERLGVGYLPKDFQAIGTKLALADGSAVEVIGYEPLAGLPA